MARSFEAFKAAKYCREKRTEVTLTSATVDARLSRERLLQKDTHDTEQRERRTTACKNSSVTIKRSVRLTSIAVELTSRRYPCSIAWHPRSRTAANRGRNRMSVVDRFHT